MTRGRRPKTRRTEPLSLADLLFQAPVGHPWPILDDGRGIPALEHQLQAEASRHGLKLTTEAAKIVKLLSDNNLCHTVVLVTVLSKLVKNSQISQVSVGR